MTRILSDDIIHYNILYWGNQESYILYTRDELIENTEIQTTYDSIPYTITVERLLDPESEIPSQYTVPSDVTVAIVTIDEEEYFENSSDSGFWDNSIHRFTEMYDALTTDYERY